MEANGWLYAVPANSPSVLACSEFAVGWVRWHGRIAIVLSFAYLGSNFNFRFFLQLFPKYKFLCEQHRFLILSKLEELLPLAFL